MVLCRWCCGVTNFSYLSGIYIGEDLRQNRQWQQLTTVTTILVLATLGSVTQREMNLIGKESKEGDIMYRYR